MRFLIVLVSFFFFHASLAETLISCHDGDTCQFRRGREVIKVRFSGMDAPELNQPFGIEAREALIRLLRDQDVTLQCDGFHFARTTCLAFVGDREVQKEMVRSGYALDFPEHSQGRYEADQDYAMKNRLGMWSQTLVRSPFCWRWPDSKECRDNPRYQK
jgi:endonuclease YncB( thermonuclease family)